MQVCGKFRRLKDEVPELSANWTACVRVQLTARKNISKHLCEKNQEHPKSDVHQLAEKI